MSGKVIEMYTIAPWHVGYMDRERKRRERHHEGIVVLKLLLGYESTGRTDKVFFFHKKAKWNCGWLFSMLKQEGKKLSVPKAILHLFRRNKPLRYCKLRWCQDKINRWFPPGCSLERGSDRHIRTSESARGNTPCKYTECMPWYDTPVGRVCKALHIPALGLIDK